MCIAIWSVHIVKISLAARRESHTRELIMTGGTGMCDIFFFVIISSSSCFFLFYCTRISRGNWCVCVYVCDLCEEEHEKKEG